MMTLCLVCCVLAVVLDAFALQIGPTLAVDAVRHLH